VLEGHTEQVTSVAFSPTDNLIVSGSLDGTMRIWDCITGTERYKIRDPGNDENNKNKGSFAWINCVAFSPNGRIVASGSLGGFVNVVDCTTGTARNLIGHSDSVEDLTFSPLDDNIMASISVDRTLRMWKVDKAY